MSGKTFPDLDKILKDFDDISTQIFVREYVPEKGSEFYEVDTTNLFDGYPVAGI